MKFNFWRNNNLSDHFILHSSSIISKFKEWKDFQLSSNSSRGIPWYEYYFGQTLVTCFITDKEYIKGLQSTFENSELEDIYKILKKYL